MPPKIPQTLGRYEILEELGRGAMGVVYLARDPLIGRLVALKTFRSGYSDGDKEMLEFRARFLREAQSAGILNHPAIVTVHDVVDSSDEEGATFIAMEYVQGTNLKERLQAVGRLDVRRAVEIVLAIADALDYAHDAGVVHRDIKPANIILNRDGEPKITDFGIARLDTSDLTQEGQLLGTPNYMAPERILGREVDHRTDIFSLGVLLYEMLTCHKPFQGDNLTMVTHRIVYEPFTPPEKYEPSIPAGIVAILDRSMQKEPVDRYGRAGEMAEELKRVLETIPVESSGAASLSATQDVSGQLELEAIESAVESASRAEPSEPSEASRGVVTTVKPAGTKSRWLRLGVIAALLAGGAALSWALVQKAQPPVDRPSAAALARTHYVPMLQAARVQLDRGRPDLAIGHVERALRVAPAAEPVLRLRDDVEAALHEIEAAEQERRRLRLLEEASRALELERLDDAEQAARRLLVESPEDEEGVEMLASIEAERERRAEARRVAARTPPALEPEPTVDTPEPTPTVATEFPLAITFFTEISRGEMQLWINDRLILNETFKFVEKVGRFRTEDRHGRFDAEIQLATGPVKVRVEIDPRGGSAVEGHFADLVEDGERRVLEIRFDAQSRVSIGLRTGDPVPIETAE